MKKAYSSKIFSIVLAVILIIGMLPAGVFGTQSNDETSLTGEGDPVKNEVNEMINLVDINAITSALFEVKTQGSSNFVPLPLPEGIEVHVGDEVHIKFHYTELTDVQANNIYYFDIPTGLSAITGQSRGDIKSDDGRIVGSYWVEDDKVKLQFTNTDYLQETENIIQEGFVNFYATLNQDAVTQEGEIKLGDTVIGVVPIVPDEEIRNVNVKKGNGTDAPGSEGLVYDPNRNAVQYTIQIDTTGNNGSIDRIDVVDTLTTTVNEVEDPSIVTGDYTDIQITPSGSATFTKGSDGKYVLSATNVAKDTTIKVTYWVPVKSGIVKAKFVNDVNATKTVGGTTTPAGDASVQGQINNTLQIQKRAAMPVFDPQTRKTTVVYTVTVTAPITNTTAIADAYVEDVFTNNGQLVLGVSKTSGDGNFESLGTIDGKPGFKVNLGTMNPGDVKTYTYTVEVDTDACYFDNAPSEKKLSNKATSKSGETGFESGYANSVFKKQFTKKEGIFDATKNLFKFTATFDGLIPGTTDQYYDGALKSIDDIILTEGFTFAGDPAPVLEAFQGNNVIKTKTLNGADFEGKSQYNMDIPEDMVGPYSYRLIYYVRLPEGYVAGETDTVNNKFTAHAVGIGAGGTDLTFESESTTSAQGSINNSLDKWLDIDSGSYDAGNNDYALQNYQLTIKSPIVQGATLTDWVDQQANSYFDIKFPLDFLKTTMNITLGGQRLTEGEDYSIEAVGDADEKFKITFLKNFPDISEQKKLEVKYKGQVVASEAGKEAAKNESGASGIHQDGVLVRNYVELNNNGMTVTKSDGGSYLGAHIEKSAVDISQMEDVTQNMICWKIKMTSGYMHGFGSGGYHPLVDTLPANQELVKIEHYTDNQEPRESVRNDSGTLGNHEYTVSEDGQTITINAYPGHRNHPETYLIWTRIKDSELAKEGVDPDNFDNKEFTNSAYLEVVGTKWNVTAKTEVSVHRNEKTFEYTGATQTEGGVRFTLTINKDGADLDPNSDTLTIHDTMNRQLALVRDSLRINDKTIDEIPGASLTYQEGSNKFDLVIPDEMKCVITYLATIDAEVGEAGWLENTAQIEGRIGTITTEDLLTEKLDVSAGSTSIYSFYLKKTDAQGKLLSTAKFLLKRVELENGQIKETPAETAANVGGISLDAADGTYKYRGVKRIEDTFDCVYSLQEIEAPAGCIKDETVHYIAFGNNVEPELKAALDAKGITLEAAHTGQGANLDTMFQLTNNDGKINIPVKKVWDDGNDTDGLRPASVTIKLKADGEVIKTQSITGEGNTWEYEFTDLPTHKTLDDATRQEIEYTVEEDAVPNYEVPIISGDAQNGFTVTNKHDVPEETSKEFTGTKTLTEGGEPKAIEAGQFKFTVAAGENNPAAIGGLPTGEISVGADGTFTLGTLTFKKAGTYTFTVSEVNGGVVGYTYDNKPVTVTVEVTLNQETNTLEVANVTYQKDGQAAEGITFANTFTEPGEASQQFTGNKTLTEGGEPKAIEAGQFKFTVAAGENNPGKIVGLPTGEMSVGTDGTFALGTLSFTKAGTYTFTVTEVNSGAAGYTYDDKPVTVTVNVALNEEDNVLEIRGVTYEKDGQEAQGITFANTYTAPEGANQPFTGNKTLTEGGQPKAIEAGQFKFTVAAGENNPAAITGLPTGEMSVGTDGTFALGTLSFTKAGTYTFIVSEVNGGAAGYTYDDKPVTVTVEVALNEETNVLEIANVTYEKDGQEAQGITFANTYTAPEGASQPFTGKKTLTEGGQPKAIEAGQFKFTVAAGENNPAAITGLPTGEMSVGTDGTFALGTLSFTKAGTYTFTVSEVNGGAAGYTYDDKPVTVTVEVALNEETNVLEIVNVTYQKDGQEAQGITFANTYTAPEGASQQFTGNKTLTEGGEPKAIEAGQFKFTVAAGENNPAAITGLPTGEISVGADGTFTLGTLSFTAAGTYTFTVSEVDGGAAGYTYDDKPVTVTVTVELNEQTNVLEITEVAYEKDGQEAQGITFANTYTKPEGAALQFTGNKTLTEGGEPKAIEAGQFKFTVAAGENNPAAITGLPTGEISVGPDGTFGLGTLSFTEAGIYTFTVSEVNGGAAGYTYDDKPVTVTVVVALVQDNNTLSVVKVTYQKDGQAADGIVFANTYETPEGAVQQFTGNKTLTEGGEPKAIEAGQFKFTVAAGENNPAAITGLPTGEISVGADGTFALGTLSFTEAGTYTFTVSEVNSAAAGYTYDDKPVTVTVEVALNEETNVLEIVNVTYQKDGQDAEGITFANTYEKPDGAAQQFTGKKTLTEGGEAKTITAGQFKFTVVAGENNPAPITGLPTGEISVGADGTFTLGTLSFTAAGTYTFTVSEVNGGAAGYTYDDKPVTVTVEVALNEETNVLEIVKVTYQKDGQDAEGIAFANTYETPEGAAQQFTGNKTLTEGGQPKAIEEGQFKFTVAASDNNPAAITGLPTGEISVGADGTFTLGTLSFTKAGTYTFTVSEVNGGAAGYTYDDKPVTVTVEVALNEETNVLEIVKVTYQKDGQDAEGITFANTYETPEGAAQQFTGNKTLTEGGQPKAIEEGQFTFTVAAGENNPAPITGLPTGEISVGADGTFTLGTLSFTKAGTYTFTVSEVNGGAAGYTYDDKPVTVTVEVALNEETNVLEIVKVTYEKDGQAAEGIAFANGYETPEGANQEFTGTKTLTEDGNDKAINQGQFKFTVAAGESNPAAITSLPTGEISVGADGTFTLGTLSFTKAGTYTFTVSEVNGGAAGYTYDDKPVTVTVEVALNEETNVLEIVKVTYQKDGQDAEGITFANTYEKPEGAAEQFVGKKTLTEGGEPKAIEAGQFTFTVAAGKNNPAPITGLPTGEISVGADGTFTLGTLSFTKVGTYTFTISEVNGQAAGYTYDDKPVTVTVEVVLNEETNILEIANVTYMKDGQASDGISFANTYETPKEAAGELIGLKTLTENGQAKPINAGQFKFTVAESETNPAPIIGLPTGEILIEADGTFTFGELRFAKAGTYTFTVSEVNSAAAGYTYDDKPVTVTVTVALNEEINVLEIIDVTYTKDGQDAEGIIFANTYETPKEASQQFTGNKELTENGEAKTIAAGQFTFTVAAGEDNPAAITGLPTGEIPVEADGSFGLGNLSFTKAGTYTFTVSEVNGGAAGYTYDDKPVTVSVVVALNEETNALEIVMVKYQKDGQEVEGIFFANTYETPAEASLEFAGNKTLTENGEPKAITEGQFKFVVSESDENPAAITGLPTGEIPVGADGNFALGKLSFTKAGTYTFVVSEVNGGAVGYTYDDKPVTVTVVVVLNEETNVLEIKEVTYLKAGEKAEGIAFANIYETPGEAMTQFTGLKTLIEDGKPKAMTEGQFKFTVEAGKDNPAAITGLPQGEILVGKDGAINLGLLRFTKAGIYTFTVSEINGKAEGYTYDDKPVTVTIIVELNEETNMLEIVKISYEKAGKDAEGIAFANTYKASEGIASGDDPVTGDSTKTLPWIVMLLLSAVGITGLCGTGFRKKSKRNAQ